MRIVYVCTDPGIPVFGRKGASVHAQAVLRCLVGRGHEVHVVTPRSGGKPSDGLSDVTVHSVSRERHDDPAEREVATRRADAEAGEVLDALHRQRPLDLVYERYSLWGAAASGWARSSSVPHLLEVNAPLVEEQARYRTLIDRDGAHRVAVETISAATAVLCVSDRVAQWARTHADTPSRVHTVANGVDTARITPAGPAVESHTFTVGFVGTLKPWHGVSVLLEAMARLVADDPTYRALLVGDGPQADPLRARAHELGLSDHVEMTGSVAPEAVPEHLHRMQVAVAPYPAMPDFYFSPLKIYEYFAAGLPVVASRVGDLPSTLQDGRLGVLVDPESPRQLADAIAMLRHQPQHRERLCRAARSEAVRAHDWSSVVERSLELVGKG